MNTRLEKRLKIDDWAAASSKKKARGIEFLRILVSEPLN
jgi:hypothetical protein